MFQVPSLSTPSRTSLSVFLLLWLTGANAIADVHQDKKHGFKITAPRGWTQVPLQLDEEWIAGRYMSDREDIYNDPEHGWSWTYTPEMRILVFPKGLDIRDTKTLSEETDEEENAIKKVTFSERNFLNYKDYKKNSIRSGGFYFSEEETDTINKVPTTCYEIKVERMSYNGPKRTIAWVYHLSDMDVAVEFTVLEDRYEDHYRAIKSSLKSFRTIAKEASESGDDVPGVIEEFAMHFGLDELTPKEREEARKHLEQVAYEKAIAGLPKGWEHDEVGRCLVLSHDCEDHARDIANHVTAILDWLDKNLYYIGPEEYVRRPILRVCKDREEENIFRHGSQSWGGISTEIVTHHDTSGWINFEDDWVNRRALQIWLQDRDKELTWAMPYWLRTGLTEVFENVRTKGRRLEFQEGDQFQRNGWRINGEELQPIPASELFRRKADASKSWQVQRQAGLLVHYLLVGKGSKSSNTKKILGDYLMNLGETVRRIEAEEDAGKDASKDDKPKTEEEEEEYYRKKAKCMAGQSEPHR